jgi:arabinosyltransferase C
VAIVAVSQLAQTLRHPLLWSWALVGLVAIYFPALFERKLAMGMSLPWAALAGVGIHAWIRKPKGQERFLAQVLVLVLVSLSSLVWLRRELNYVRNNVASTTVHPVRLSPAATQVVNYLSQQHNPTVIAFPGIPQPMEGGGFTTPYLPDLNPILVGLAGCKDPAGHWSETPDYGRNRAQAQAFIASAGQQGREILDSAGPEVFAVVPQPATYPQLGLPDPRPMGELVLETPQYLVIRVRL